MPDRSLQTSNRLSGASIDLAAAGIWPPTWPMGLTMLRLLLLPVFLWILLLDAGPEAAGAAANPHRWWAMGVFAVMAVTDKLDGYLARRLNQTSKLGTLLDPVADKLLVASSLVLLGSEWVAAPGYRIPLYVLAAVYAKDVVLVVGALLLVYVVGGVTVKPRPLGKVGTFLQLVLVILVLIAPDLDRLLAGSARTVLVALERVVALVAVLAGADYVWQGMRQYREAPASRSVG